MTPVCKHQKIQVKLWDNLYESKQPKTKPKFNHKDFVRITEYRKTFKRGYTANYTD